MTNQPQDLEHKAREALGTVERMGVDFVRGSQYHHSHLSYGLDKGLFDQSAVDGAQTTYRTNAAREALGTVERMGVDFVRESQYYNSHLSYGLEHGLFKQADIDTAQKRYEASRRK